MKRGSYLLLLPALCVLCIDQASKILVHRHIRLGEAIPVISGFFNLVHARNRGVAFGIMNNPDNNLIFYISIAASLLAICLLILWYGRLKPNEFKPVFGFSMIIGGALGNLIDRFRFREVIDFLDVYVGAYHWPAFNIADSAITIGVILVALGMVFKRPIIQS